MLSWHRFRALCAFEVRAQAREPLTWLYGMVFLLLAFGYASSDAVELVTQRGSTPRTTSWALMLAFGGLTAFGQVITTMIATTAMLRDEAQRTRALIATSGVTPRVWCSARLSAAVLVMLTVYAAMPVGVLVGTVVRAVAESAPLGATLRSATMHALVAYGVITIPTMLVVTIVLAAAAVYTQRVLGVLVAALALVACWQLSLTLVAQADARTIGALLDPFGNAPVLAVTVAWTEAQKASATVPLWPLLLTNRMLWMGGALGVAAIMLTHGTARMFTASPAAAATRAHRGVPRLLRRLARASSARASIGHFTAGWIALDGGWRIVSVLAVLNATANAWTIVRTPGATASAVLMVVSAHSRVFLILLATVYAGELVWRERDARVDQLLDAVGVSPRALFVGRLRGLARAQLAVMAPLAGVGLLLALWCDGTATTFASWLVWSVFVLWLPFVQLTALSLLVHVLLNQKVAAHLLLITGWVMAVALNQRGVSTWWVRFADAPSLPVVLDAPTVSLYAQRGAYWSAVGAALLWIAYRRWPAGAATGVAVTSRR